MHVVILNGLQFLKDIIDPGLSLICDQRYGIDDMRKNVIQLSNMFRGKYVYLRLMEPEDYVNTFRWRNDYDMQLNIGGPVRFISKEMERNWAQKVSLDNTNNLYLAICLVENDQMIGWYSINDIDYRNRKCYCGGVVIGEKEYRDGIAFKEAGDLAFRYIIYELNMNRVTGICLKENVMSRAVMEASYWKLEGIEREAIYKNGSYHDKCHYAILRADFFEHKKNGDYEERAIIRRIGNAIKRIKAELKAEENQE